MDFARIVMAEELIRLDREDCPPSIQHARRFRAELEAGQTPVGRRLVHHLGLLLILVGERLRLPAAEPLPPHPETRYGV
jgi:hypothetical protein